MKTRFSVLFYQNIESKPKLYNKIVFIRIYLTDCRCKCIFLTLKSNLWCLRDGKTPPTMNCIILMCTKNCIWPSRARSVRLSIFENSSANSSCIGFLKEIFQFQSNDQKIVIIMNASKDRMIFQKLFSPYLQVSQSISRDMEYVQMFSKLPQNSCRSVSRMICDFTDKKIVTTLFGTISFS